jgi:hypothetical protein
LARPSINTGCRWKTMLPSARRTWTKTSPAWRAPTSPRSAT